MDTQAITALLEQNIAEASVQVEGDGSHFNLLIVSPVFEDLRPVQKQQLVYKVINEKIADGSMHAVNMQLFTPEQWAAKNA